MNEHHIESTSYRGSNASYTPENFRHIIQRQIQHTVDRAVDSAITLSIGDFDGRFLGNFPGRTQSLQNGKGQFYHVAGVSRGGDLSVAAP
jgi:hypothetical protein